MYSALGVRPGSEATKRTYCCGFSAGVSALAGGGVNSNSVRAIFAAAGGRPLGAYSRVKVAVVGSAIQMTLTSSVAPKVPCGPGWT